MIAPDGRETARGAWKHARLNIAGVKSPGTRSKAACAPRFSGAQELPKRRCACALLFGACGFVDMSDTRVSRRRSVRRLGRFSRGASARRVERRVRSCDTGGQVASRVPRGRASSRRREGTEGPQGERVIFARVPELGSLALGLSRAPIARARSRRARHRRAHAVQTTRTRDIRGQRCPREASRAVAPKRARSSTSSGAPGRAREGAREGGKHRKAGNLPGTHRARKRGAPSPREPQTGLLEAVPQPSGYPLTVATLRGGFYPG